MLARIVVSSATSWPGVELEERHAETIAERSPSRRSDPGGQNFRPGDYIDPPRKIFCNLEKYEPGFKLEGAFTSGVALGSLRCNRVV